MLSAEGLSQCEAARMFGVWQKVPKNCDATTKMVSHICGGAEVAGVWPQPEKANKSSEW